jgi:hypothetical protein
MKKKERDCVEGESSTEKFQRRAAAAHGPSGITTRLSLKHNHVFLSAPPRLRGLFFYEAAPFIVMSERVAPEGSVMTQKRPTLGMSVGGTQTLPPRPSTRAARASTSSTAT